MATTALIPLHVGKGKTVASALGRSMDYVENPNKTNEGEFISSYECDPLIAEQEFLFSKSQYTSLTGRNQGSRDVIAYHLRQSFRPDEVTPEIANKIGYDCAMSLTKGKHAFLVCTHVDKDHVHSHIIFNSTTLDYTRKFKNFWGSTFAVRRISDRICLENGLSIIEAPKKSQGHYGKWLGDNKPRSHSDRLRLAIDEVLAGKPVDYSRFLLQMQEQGYENKQGKYLAFKGKSQKKFIRVKSLGSGYSEEEIQNVIKGKCTRKIASKPQQKQVNLLVDIQAKLQQGKGAGYEQWAKIFNLKQMASTLNYLREHDMLDYESLEKKAAEATNHFDTLNSQIKSCEVRMTEIKTLKSSIITYMKTKDIYAQYKKSGYSKKVYEKYESELILHKSAREHFNKLELKTLPKIKTLDTEFNELLSKKKKAYSQYHVAKKEMQELLIMKQNVVKILGVDEKKVEKQKSQDR
ncbi:MAG: relaxase/mobilization nuclease domain-containing protein [Eubacteriales bacterium]